LKKSKYYFYLILFTFIFIATISIDFYLSKKSTIGFKSIQCLNYDNNSAVFSSRKDGKIIKGSIAAALGLARLSAIEFVTFDPYSIALGEPVLLISGEDLIAVSKVA
jgi:hypothetical protein